MEIDKPKQDILKDPRKRRVWIIFQFQKNGMNLTQVAEAAGVTRQCLYHCLRTPYPHMEHILSKAMGLTPQYLFPERYDRDGLPNRRRGPKPKKKRVNNSCHDNKHSAVKAQCNTQLAEAA